VYVRGCGRRQEHQEKGGERQKGRATKRGESLTI